MNVFAGGPQINEKFSESLETPKDPLKNSKLDGGGLYKPFNPDEKYGTTPAGDFDPSDAKKDVSQHEDTGIENIKNPEKSKKNSKYSNIIIRLFDTKKIGEDTRNILLSEDLENIDISSLEGITDENEKKVLNSVFEKMKNKPNNLKSFQKEIKALKNKQYLNDFDLEIKDGKYDSEVLNMIGGNYIEFPNSENKKEIEKDLSVAIELTKVDIERKYTNFNRDNESYKVAIKNIESGELSKQMEGIESLYILAASKAGELGKTTIDKYKKKRIEKLIEEFQKLNKEFDALEAQKTTEEINKRKKEINERITEIGNEANEIEAGDIFEATKLETTSNNTEG